MAKKELFYLIETLFILRYQDVPMTTKADFSSLLPSDKKVDSAVSPQVLGLTQLRRKQANLGFDVHFFFCRQKKTFQLNISTMRMLQSVKMLMSSKKYWKFSVVEKKVSFPRVTSDTSFFYCALPCGRE